MTENKDGFGKRLKKGIDTKLIAIIVLVIYNIGEGFYITYQEGKEQEQFQEFKDNSTTLIEQELEAPKLLTKIFDSKFVENFAVDKQKEIEETIVNGILRKDSTKVDFIQMLGLETGLRDEAVKEKFKEMFKQYIEGDLLTVDEAKELIRKRTINANF